MVAMAREGGAMIGQAAGAEVTEVHVLLNITTRGTAGVVVLARSEGCN